MAAPHLWGGRRRSWWGGGEGGKHRGLGGSGGHVGRDVGGWERGDPRWGGSLLLRWQLSQRWGGTKGPQPPSASPRQEDPILIPFLSSSPGRSPALHQLEPNAPHRPAPPPHLLGAELSVQLPGSVVPDEVMQRVSALRPLPARARREHPPCMLERRSGARGGAGRGAGRNGARSGAGRCGAGGSGGGLWEPPGRCSPRILPPRRPASWDL